MKNFSWLIISAVCLFFFSCEKPQSEADRKAEIEKEVQSRLDAEQRAAEQQRLAQQQADLDAREKALAAKEEATATPEPTRRTVSGSGAVTSSDEEAPRSYDTFYRKLEPYGAWRESADYGYVWQPRVAQQSRNWRPYTDGRWTYTDAGWTWVSNEPFGWATCHYGRWTRLTGVGWVWVPGDEWAPAWVSWRTSDQHVGWAPLPPEARFEKRTGIKQWADNYYDIDAGEYVFVPNEDIGDENIQGAVVPVEQNVTIVSETTNVTNITYTNTMIVNEGPNFDRLRGRSRRPVERLKLQREFDAERDHNPRSVVNGQTLQVVTPLFTARATARPRTAAPPIPRATVERITTTGDQAALTRARQKMKSEATPPPDAPSKKFEKPTVSEAAPAAPVATSSPAATAAPIAAPTARSTPVMSATIAPSATPRPTIASTPPPPTATPTPRPTIANTPPATATPPPRFTPPPRPAMSATVAASVTATARPVMTPRVIPTVPVQRATPPPAAATPVPTAAGEPSSTPAAGTDQRQMKLDEQMKRQQAREKALEGNRRRPATPAPATEASPVTTPVAPIPPRQVATPQPKPADMTEGTPAGIEIPATPRPGPKRPPRALPPSVSPTPAGAQP